MGLTSRVWFCAIAATLPISGCTCGSGDAPSGGPVATAGGGGVGGARAGAAGIAGVAAGKGGAGGSGGSGGGGKGGGASGGVGGAAGGGASGAGGVSGQSGSPSLITAPKKVVPASWAGLEQCTDASCADAARACDDALRSGCVPKLAGRVIPDPGLTNLDPTFRGAVTACAYGVKSLATERIAEESKGALPEVKASAAHAFVLEIARCTRNAVDCEGMFNCLRGQVTPFPLPPPLAKDLPTVQQPISVPKPEYTTPFAGQFARTEGPELPPWGRPPELLSGVDSPSCAACVSRRCPNFAYQCFGAEASDADCPGGDCCQSFRRCVDDCGGYSPQASVARFDRCVAICRVGRPNAVQELTNMIGCWEQGCVGCEALDSTTIEAVP